MSQIADIKKKQKTFTVWLFGCVRFNLILRFVVKNEDFKES